MNVVVCVKQIPDPALPGELDPSTNTLKRDGKLILDESDSYGVEMALQLATAAGGIRVERASGSSEPLERAAEEPVNSDALFLLGAGLLGFAARRRAA